MTDTLSRISTLMHLSFLTLVGLTFVFDFDVEWTVRSGSHYGLALLYILLSALTPTLLITSRLGQLDDAGPYRNADATKNLSLTFPLFLVSLASAWYAYTRPDMQFFPIAGILMYAVASGGLTLFQLGILLTDAPVPQKRR